MKKLFERFAFLAMLVLAVIFIIIGIAEEIDKDTQHTTETPTITLKADEPIEPLSEPLYVISNDDIEIIAKTLYGECLVVKSDMERAAVVWVILNRIDSDDPFYPDTIEGVVTQKAQFAGYDADNPVIPELAELAKDVITRWHEESDGYGNIGRVLPTDYLWFEGDGKANTFRNAYIGGEPWDWSYTNPYKN